MTISDNLMSTMTMIGKAIEKGAIEDTRLYLHNCETITTNGLPGVRADKINTNLSKMVASDDVEIKMFSRSSWKGVLVVDNRNKMLFSVCTKNTLERITKNKIRRSPHYAQTMVNIINKDEVAEVKQMTIDEWNPTFAVTFSEEDFEKDFFSIMEDAVCEYEGYRFWVVSYEVEKFVMKSLSAILMDRDFDRVQEISILESLKPNFGELTAVEPKKEKKKDVRSLLSVKPGIPASKSTEPEKRTEILPKSVEESKEA
jgi:hypothetical protein